MQAFLFIFSIFVLIQQLLRTSLESPECSYVVDFTFISSILHQQVVHDPAVSADSRIVQGCPVLVVLSVDNRRVSVKNFPCQLHVTQTGGLPNAYIILKKPNRFCHDSRLITLYASDRYLVQHVEAIAILAAQNYWRDWLFHFFSKAVQIVFYSRRVDVLYRALYFK